MLSKPMTNEEYCALNGSYCPYCGSDEIVGDSVQVDGSFVTQPISCLDCENKWENTYILTAYDPAGEEEITMNHIDKVISERGK